MNNIVLIAAVEAEEAARRTGGTAEDKLRAAMKATRHHWIATSEDDQLMAACEGAARTMEPEDVKRLEAELSLFQALAAASSGVPVDFGAMLPEEGEERPAPIGVRKLWLEVTDPSKV